MAVMILLILVPVSLNALEIPSKSGRVNDLADMLAPQTEDYLDVLLAELEDRSDTSMVVLTIQSLEGDPLEEFSLRVARKWRSGHAGEDKCVLLLVVRKGRKVRLEVGYGLSSRLTDVEAEYIIRAVIAPHFSKGLFDQGVAEAVRTVIDAIHGKFTVKGLLPGLICYLPLNLQIGIGIVACLLLLTVMLQDNFFSGAAACGVIAALCGTALFDLDMLFVLFLIPAGFLAGLVLTLVWRLFSSRGRYAAYRFTWGDDDDGDGNSSGGW